MNKQLKALDRAAQKYAGSVVGNDEYANPVEWFNVYKEKLAQLIVAQSLAICKKTTVKNPPNDLFEGYNLGVNKAAENIKEHFEDSP